VNKFCPDHKFLSSNGLNPFQINDEYHEVAVKMLNFIREEQMQPFVKKFDGIFDNFTYLTSVVAILVLGILGYICNRFDWFRQCEQASDGGNKSCHMG
jgi:hypothetical protein